MLKNSLLTLSLLLPLTAISATANAGATITATRHWARQSVQDRTTNARSNFNSAFAYDQTASRLQPVTVFNEGGSAWRYQGGPHPR